MRRFQFQFQFQNLNLYILISLILSKANHYNKKPKTLQGDILIL